jgi:putative NADH-flavin reductase
MKLAIIGAGAGIGLQTVLQAVEKGHHVTALSRNTSTLPEHSLLTKINGSADQVEDLKKAMLHADVVIITVGTKIKKDTKLFSDIARALIQAATALDYKGSVMVVTGFGTGESSRYLSFFMRTVISLFLKDQYKDKTVMEELITQSNMKWEIIKPGMLSDGKLTKTYKVLPKLEKGMKVGKISRADVAHFLIHEAEHQKLLYQQVALTN